MQNKKDIEELKTLHGERLTVKGERDPHPIEATPTITMAQTETSTRKPIDAEDIEDSLRVDDSEKELIRRALELTKGNRKEAAARLGFSERTLYRKIKEYGL